MGFLFSGSGATDGYTKQLLDLQYKQQAQQDAAIAKQKALEEEARKRILAIQKGLLGPRMLLANNGSAQTTVNTSGNTGDTSLSQSKKSLSLI